MQFSIKSKTWQIGLIIGLLLLACLLSIMPYIEHVERDLFLYLLGLSAGHKDGIGIGPDYLVPQWIVFLVYALIMTLYVTAFSRSQATVVSRVIAILFLFGLLMLGTILVVFFGVFLPVLAPTLVVVVFSMVFAALGIYRWIIAKGLFGSRAVSLEAVRSCIRDNDLKQALMMLKQCSYSDDVLDTGYELGMLLEANQQWVSAANLYHWLSEYDPGLSDFVTRVEGVLDNRLKMLESIKSTSVAETDALRLGHYRLIKRIARGSTSIVYEAIDRRTHNRVALKVMTIRSEEQVQQEHVRGWLNEANIVSQLDHRNIVKIHDADIQGDSAYIAMDYISGYAMTLRLKKREYLTVGECIRIFKGLLHGLDEVHRQGIVHGDIKPANIIYDTQRDSYILTDFGAAYLRQRSRQTGKRIVGTPAYMSPEQLQGKGMDGRSDLFSLAVTVYHLLTGELPFANDSLPELKKSILNQEPNLDRLVLPEGLVEILLKALQKKPYMRFADALQMLNSVERCETELRARLRH